ncbi:MAG TPA: hypothetical protein VI729_06880 [Anaerolineales bacterium]|nr:hypothetical protein [Anaerolineales bacterium]
MNDSESRQRSIWLILGGAIGIGGSLIAAAVVAGLAVLAYFQGGEAAALGPGIQAISLVAAGVLGLPLLYWAAHGSNRPARRIHWAVGPLAGMMFFGGLALGGFAFSRGTAQWVLGPVAHLMAAGGPVVFTASLALRQGPILSNRRGWGHFLGGLWAAPPIALILELLALIPAAVLVFLGLAVSERGLSVLQAMAAADLTSDSDFNQLLGGLISEPVVLGVAIAFLAAVVPLIEESVKSVSIWPVIQRRPSVGQAFLGGVLAGSGYALFESLLLAQPGADWVSSMVARAGTPLIHAFGTGLVSWGLIEAIVNRRPLRLLALFLMAVGFHGIWNFTALLVALSGFSLEIGAGVISPEGAKLVALSGLLVLLSLSAVALVGLVGLPRWLAKR